MEIEGVLVADSSASSREAFIQLAREEGLAPPLAWQLKRITDMKVEQAISESLCWTRDPAQISRLAARHVAIYDALTKDHPPQENVGARRLLETLRLQGVPVGAVSSAPEARSRATLARLGIAVDNARGATGPGDGARYSDRGSASTRSSYDGGGDGYVDGGGGSGGGHRDAFMGGGLGDSAAQTWSSASSPSSSPSSSGYGRGAGCRGDDHGAPDVPPQTVTGACHPATPNPPQVLFQTLVTGSDVRRAKPDPELLLMACQDLDRPPLRTVVLGTSNLSIEAAREVGMQCVCVAGTNPVYELGEADMVVTSLDKVTFMNLKGLFGPEAGREPMFPEAEMEKQAEPAAERPTLFSDEDDFWNK